MTSLRAALKRLAARLIKWPLMPELMKLGIRVVVPRQRVGVSLVALNEQGEVFLLRHVFHPYAPWGLPGGWMGRNETPEACLHRELEEETGLQAKLGPVVHVEFDPNPAHIVIAYMGRLLAGEEQLSAEILESAWFPVDELPAPLYDFTRHAIANAVQMERTLPLERWMN